VVEAEDTAAAVAAEAIAATRTGTQAAADMGLTTTRQANMHRTGRAIHPLHTGKASQSWFLDNLPSASISPYDSARSLSTVAESVFVSIGDEADGGYVHVATT